MWLHYKAPLVIRTRMLLSLVDQEILFGAIKARHVNLL
jgi:hypothetical protein